MPYESRIPQIVVQMQERLKAAEKEAARRVAAKARERAPVKTGRLRNSIHAAGNQVVSDVPYARFVEYGTSNAAPHPFMTPAAEEVRPEFEQLVRDGLRDATK